MYLRWRPVGHVLCTVIICAICIESRISDPGVKSRPTSRAYSPSLFRTHLELHFEPGDLFHFRLQLIILIGQTHQFLRHCRASPLQVQDLDLHREVGTKEGNRINMGFTHSKRIFGKFCLIIPEVPFVCMRVGVCVCVGVPGAVRFLPPAV